MTKVNVLHMDPNLAPQNREHCGHCDHTQNFHLSVKGPYVEGFPVPCRAANCPCAIWVPTWGVSRG
jgi:hypothetical protein